MVRTVGTAEPCRLCLAAAQPHAPRPKDTRFKPLVDALLPWLLAFGFVLPLTFAVEGTLRIFSAGLACGVLVGATSRASSINATARPGSRPRPASGLRSVPSPMRARTPS